MDALTELRRRGFTIFNSTNFYLYLSNLDCNLEFHTTEKYTSEEMSPFYFYLTFQKIDDDFFVYVRLDSHLKFDKVRVKFSLCIVQDPNLPKKGFGK